MAVSNNNPIRDRIVTDEPCPIRTLWEFDHDDDSPRSLAVGVKGQALECIKFIVGEAFDAGTIVIGKTGTTNAYMTTLNLVGLPVGAVVIVEGLLAEFTEDTEIILTITGNPTTGQLDGWCDFTHQMSRAK